MNELWIPERKPPQLEPAAKNEVVGNIYEYGLTNYYNAVILPTFKERLDPLAEEFKKQGFVSKIHEKDVRPTKALQAGIAVTAFAYLESGYEIDVNSDALIIAEMDASLVGVPDVYIASAADDSALGEVLSIISNTPEFKDDAEDDNLGIMLALGSGWVRHYLQHSLAA